MDVKIDDYSQGDKNYVDYLVTGLTDDQLKFIQDNLEEEIEMDGDNLKIRMYFDDNLFPFNSDEAKFKLNDFIAREEIEMNVFLSSFLENL
ncbi:MAG: hypothetical protein Q4P18_05435 [Methanobrevibacter sp.]|uniref:DUF5750 family protein n=1 Tax=Methanobrevibacter sp. TaxID=66852 RepID=UPI0026DF31B0|nr:DUF5750 family protein [Methanobrevibacter sp.]MDO5848956.1 hypothetical protein [Methanobrevibacter sp.]